MISHSVLPTMKTFSVKSCTENRNTHFVFNEVFRHLVFYEIIWENVFGLGRPQMTNWSIRIVCCIHKTTNTHSEYIILIAFPLQQKLHQNASMSRYAYIAYHDNSKPNTKLKHGALGKCSEFPTKLVGYYNSHTVVTCQGTFRSCFFLKNSRVQISNADQLLSLRFPGFYSRSPEKL